MVASISSAETTFDTLNLKAALFAVDRYFEEHSRRVPVMASVTIVDKSGRTLSGQNARGFLDLHFSFSVAQRGDQLCFGCHGNAPVCGRAVRAVDLLRHWLGLSPNRCRNHLENALGAAKPSSSEISVSR